MLSLRTPKAEEFEAAYEAARVGIDPSTFSDEELFASIDRIKGDDLAREEIGRIEHGWELQWLTAEDLSREVDEESIQAAIEERKQREAHLARITAEMR